MGTLMFSYKACRCVFTLMLAFSMVIMLTSVSSGGPQQTGEPQFAPIEVAGLTGNHVPVHHRDDNDFVQAGNLYRLMSDAEKQRLVGNIAASLSQVSRKDIIDRSIANFRNADPEYGNRVAEAMANRRTSSRTTSDEKAPAVALRT